MSVWWKIGITIVSGIALSFLMAFVSVMGWLDYTWASMIAGIGFSIVVVALFFPQYFKA